MSADARPLSFTVEEVPAGVTIPLRSAVLRPGRPPAIEGDDDPATFHLAARTAEGQVVGVVRFHPAPCAWRSAAAPWQLRGMATDPAVRGAGAGRALVTEGLARVTARGGDLVWCDARVAAAGFYERMGFQVVTEQYEKPTLGPHLGMVMDLAAPTPRELLSSLRVAPEPSDERELR
jgi:predicted GNAT family N-acyltransferase